MDLVIGVGEIGSGILKLLSTVVEVAGLDAKRSLCVGEVCGPIEIMHICYPYSDRFFESSIGYIKDYSPSMVVIHSTVKPGTTLHLDKEVSGNPSIVFSPVRGVHRRMLEDLRKYTKFYSSYSAATDLFEKRFKSMNVRVRRASTPLVLEYAKILVDTTYYGWLITFAQKTKIICEEMGLDYDELWSFAEEPHSILGNRPKMYVDPNGIGGHCILPNLELIAGDMPEIREVMLRINEETKTKLSGVSLTKDICEISPRKELCLRQKCLMYKENWKNCGYRIGSQP